MTVIDLARRRAELERMNDAAQRTGNVICARQPSSNRPVDMRQARRMAELRARPRVFEDPFWADRHAPDPV